MEEILKLVSVSDYDLFRKTAMERACWTKAQYNDRKIGRTKLSTLERNMLMQVVAELPSYKLLNQTKNTAPYDSPASSDKVD